MITVAPAPGTIEGDAGALLIGFAREADALGFDLLLLGYAEDRLDLEPLTSAAALCGVTQRIGLCAKATTRLGEPFTLARGFAALDHLSGGRAAWQVSTRAPSGTPAFAHRPTLAPADEAAATREFVAATFALWDSWSADALTFDKERAEFSDPARVHRVDYEGRFFSVRGPLNTPRPRQGRPVIVHPAGTDLEWAAATGDVLLLAADTADPAALAEQCRQAAAAQGRRIRILLETTAEAAPEAHAQAQLAALDGLHVVTPLGSLSGLSGMGGLGTPEPRDGARSAGGGTLRERWGVPL